MDRREFLAGMAACALPGRSVAGPDRVTAFWVDYGCPVDYVPAAGREVDEVFRGVFGAADV